ncbi:hypothetical protein PoHVEF18_006060 [Penicillium ochrochloron]
MPVLQMIPGFILAAGVIILPFSPRWLASKGHNEEAFQSLAKLRSLLTSDKRVRQEYMDILVEVCFAQFVQDNGFRYQSNWLNNFIVGLITPPLVEDTGYGAYVFFAGFCVLSGVWTFFFMPETMDRTLEQMDYLFKDNSSEYKRERRHVIEAIVWAEREYA